MRCRRWGVSPSKTGGFSTIGAGIPASTAAGAGGGGVGICASAIQRTEAITVSVLAAAAPETVVPIPEEHVEGGERAVAAGDVRLHVHLLRVGELGVAVDLLLQYARAVADHPPLVEERRERQLLGLQRRVARLEPGGPASPAGRQRRQPPA